MNLDGFPAVAAVREFARADNRVQIGIVVLQMSGRWEHQHLAALGDLVALAEVIISDMYDALPDGTTGEVNMVIDPDIDPEHEYMITAAGALLNAVAADDPLRVINVLRPWLARDGGAHPGGLVLGLFDHWHEILHLTPAQIVHAGD